MGLSRSFYCESSGVGVVNMNGVGVRDVGEALALDLARLSATSLPWMHVCDLTLRICIGWV